MKPLVFAQSKQTKRSYRSLLAWLGLVLLIEALVCAMNILLKGEISVDYLITGLVTSLVVTGVMMNKFLYFNHKTRKTSVDAQAISSVAASHKSKNDRLLTDIFQADKLTAEKAQPGISGFNAGLVSSLNQPLSPLELTDLLFNALESTMITDAHDKIIWVNKAFSHVTGYLPDEVIGTSCSMLHASRHHPGFHTQMWETLTRHDFWQGEIWHKHKNGEVFAKQVRFAGVRDAQGRLTHFIATHLEAGHDRMVTDEIERLAFYDPLTGLPNRRLLQDRLKLALAASHRSCRKGAILFIDLDNFKILNDTLGHDKGDLLLQQVAERLISCVREGDTVARLGGDEFVIVLENLSEHAYEAAKFAESIGHKIQNALCQPYMLITHDYRSTPSIGAALFTGHDHSMDELLKHADIAMYQAKNSGRNAFRFFDPRMQATITARVEMENDLRMAVNEQQFELFYQPQVQQNRQVIGAEVLLRWRHPQKGLVTPGDFIQISEETGMILSIGLWVLDNACQQIKHWEKSPQTRHLQLAVNVSAHQFRQPDFVEQVCRVLHRTGINPERLKLELTETVVLDDIDDTVLKMNALRVIGVRFSMDDFGTGYSSLSSLKKLPIDQLKIDQSFVRDILIDSDDTIIVQTIISMANHLGMEVIAEGVETEAQRAFLEAHDCTMWQGYLFGKPVQLDAFEKFLQEQPRLAAAYH